MKKGKFLATVKIDKITLAIKTTAHAEKRLKERKISSYLIVSNILALDEKVIKELQEKNEETMIIDKKNNASIVIKFTKKAIMILTVIDKANLFIKEDTKIVRI